MTAPTEILFFRWVTLTEQKWVIFRERRSLPPDKRKARAKFQKKLLDVVDQGLFDFDLATRIGSTEEIKKVRIFENLGGKVGCGRRKREGEIILRLPVAVTRADFYLQ